MWCYILWDINRQLLTMILKKYFSSPKSNFHASFIWDFRVLWNYVRQCGQNEPIALVSESVSYLWVKVEAAPTSPGIESKGPGPKSWPLQSTSPLQVCQFSQFFLLFFCYFFVTFEKNKRQLTSIANQCALMVMAI